MNKILYILVITLFSLSLEAYSKKIILASFTTQERADAMITSLAQRSPSLYELSKKYKFDIKVKTSGKYYILIAEVFTNKEGLESTFKSVKKRFKGAYISNYEAPEILKQEKNLIPKKVLEEIPKEKKIEEIKVATPNIIERSKEIILPLYHEYFAWYYILIFIILSTGLYYYIKFKRIYDEY